MSLNYSTVAGILPSKLKSVMLWIRTEINTRIFFISLWILQRQCSVQFLVQFGAVFMAVLVKERNALGFRCNKNGTIDTDFDDICIWIFFRYKFVLCGFLGDLTEYLRCFGQNIKFLLCCSFSLISNRMPFANAN